MRMLIVVLVGLMFTACGPIDDEPSGDCCKVCTSSKACGDSCIPKSSTCNKSSGCACNG